MVENHDTTQLLVAARRGDRHSFDLLFSRVYDDLRRIAHHRLQGHRPGETLNTTALVHEAYVRLVDRSSIAWQDRAHFLAVASRAMRFIIINYAEARAARKRGGGVTPVPLDAVQVAADEQALDLLALHEALEELDRYNDRLGRLIEYRFFGGLTYDEIAEVTGCSVPTVKRDWTRARGWLHRFMQTVDA
jgi:RNA polymerase sigma factor (TIGR02999 family)